MEDLAKEAQDIEDSLVREIEAHPDNVRLPPAPRRAPAPPRPCTLSSLPLSLTPSLPQ